MSYHRTLGSYGALGALKCVQSRVTNVKTGGTVCEKYACTGAGEKLVQSRPGSYTCVKPEGSSAVSIPAVLNTASVTLTAGGKVSASSSGSGGGAASASTSSASSAPSPAAASTPKPTTAAAALDPATTSAGKSATSFTRLLADRPTVSSAATQAAQAQAQADAGLNWLPWALGAAGVVGIIWLVRR